MNVRSLLTLVLIFALVTVSVWVAQANRQPVTVTVPGLTPFAAPLWAVLFLTLLSGIFLALVYALAMTSREAVDRWRRKRRGEPARERAVRFDQGLRSLVMGDAAAAREQLSAVAQEEPTRAEAWLYAGTAARRSGDPEEATEMHLRALGLLPDDPRVLAELSADAEASGDTSRAVRYQQKLIEAAGSTPDRRRRVRDLHLAGGRLEAAVEAQRQLVAASPTVDAAATALLDALRVQVGRAELAAGEPARAAEIAREALASDPSFEPAHALLVESLLAGDDPEAALEAYAAAVAATGSLELLRRHADVLLDMEEPEAAIRLLREAIDRTEGSRRIGARILLGRLYYRLELVDESFQEFRELDELAEASPLVDYFLAKLEARRGDTQGAFERLKEAVRRAGFLDLTYRCPACGTVGPAYGDRCSELCPCGRVEMVIERDARPARPVEAPTV